MLALLVLGASACGKDDETEQRARGGGHSNIFGSAPPAAPADAGPPPNDAGASLGVSLDASAPAACTADGGANCPMFHFMKTDVAQAFAGKKTAALVSALEQLAAHAPAGYANWASIGKDGAAAAKAGDWNAVKASCRGCHTQYKDKYIAEHRGAPLHGRGTDGGT